MNEKRRKFLEENKIPVGGFRDKFVIDKKLKVKYTLSNKIGEKGYFIGFDGTGKSWEDLTEEEKQNFMEGQKQIPQNLKEFAKKNIGKEPGE